MSIDNDNVIDIISLEPDGKTVTLTVSDHLDWSQSDEHQRILQAKLNRYLAFVDSGELPKRYPAARGLKVQFEVMMMNRPDRAGEAFLSRAIEAFAKLGFALKSRVFAQSYDN
jgi:hypothetical protein